MDKPPYTSITLEELRRIETEVQRVNSIDGLRPLFERLQSIRRTFIDDFDVQLAIGQVQQSIVDRGRVLRESRYEAAPENRARRTSQTFQEAADERDAVAAQQTAPSEDIPPDVQHLDARSWKRATYIGAFFAIILFAAFFYLIQTARKLNLGSETPASSTGQGKNAATAQQDKPRPGLPPVPTTPTLRLYTDLTPGAVSIDGAPAQPLQNGTLQIDSLKPGHHTVQLTGPNGSASFQFDSAEKTAPNLAGVPSGDNAMVVAVSTQGGQGRLTSNAQNATALVDNKDVGEISPAGLSLSDLGQADHDLQVKQGADSQRFVLTYEPGPALTVFVKSDLNAGSLVVLTGTDGADVFVDNQKTQRKTDHGQLYLPNLKTGVHTVRVAKAGFLEVPPQTVELKKGEEKRLVFHLQAQPPPTPVPATLQITGASPGTEVLIDGASVTTTGEGGAATAPNVAAGDHKIELRHDGAAVKTFQRTFKAGETVTLNANETSAASAAAAGGTPAVKAPAANAFPPGPAPPEAKPDQAAPSSPAEPASMPGSIHKGGGFLIYHDTKTAGRYSFTLQLRRGGGFLKAKRLQWFLGFEDTRNYVLFQVDGKHFTVRQFVDGKAEELQRVPFDGNPENYVQIQMTVAPHSVETRLRPSDGGWETMGVVSGITENLTSGKFGVLISGNDEIGVSSVRFGP